jgi:hypothetical protein
MNANNKGPEATLGVDVIYYHEERKAFVLVQYKKMRKEGRANRLSYRPDTRLAGQLERMRKLDERSAGIVGDFPLLSTPCWLKLCDPSPKVDRLDEWIRGMYLAREYFEELLEGRKGLRGGVRLGYDNVPRHVTNTLFVDLVRDGWIGTRGTATDEVMTAVRESLAADRAVMLGVQTRNMDMQSLTSVSLEA